MKVFFDNCTTPIWASTLHGFVSHFGHSAHHIKDLPCGRHAADLEWIQMLSGDDSDWLVITGDDRIHRNRAERRAFRQAGLKGFVLAAAYQKTPIHQVASILLWRWPEIEQVAEALAPPALLELTITRAGKFRQLPL